MRLTRARPLAAFVMICAALPLGAQGAALSLEQALSRADSGSEAIRLKELALQKSRAAVTEAASRALPHIDLQASASYLVNPFAGYTITEGELGTLKIPALGVNQAMPTSDITIGNQLHNYFSAEATLTQPLFTWGKILNAVDMASLQADAAGTDLVAQRRDIAREVSRAYFGAVLAHRSQAVLQHMRDTARLIVADRQRSFDEGTTNREPVLDAQANLAALEAQLTAAAQAETTARVSIGILAGADAETADLGSDFRPALPALDEASLVAAALKGSTDMAASRTRITMAQKKLALERGGSILLPDVSLQTSFSVTDQQDWPYADFNADNGQFQWDLIISVAVKTSVFDGLSSAARVTQAEKDAEAAGVAVTQEEKLVRLSVRRAVEAAVKADADVTRKRAKADYAAERARNAQASSDAGFGTREDAHGADILSGAAELDWLGARYAREEALADIARITGERL